MIRVIGEYVYLHMSLSIYTWTYGLTETILAAGQVSVLLIRHYIDFDCILFLEGYSVRIIHRYTSGLYSQKNKITLLNIISHQSATEAQLCA